MDTIAADAEVTKRLTLSSLEDVVVKKPYETAVAMEQLLFKGRDAILEKLVAAREAYCDAMTRHHNIQNIPGQYARAQEIMQRHPYLPTYFLGRGPQILKKVDAAIIARNASVPFRQATIPVSDPTRISIGL